MTQYETMRDQAKAARVAEAVRRNFRLADFTTHFEVNGTRFSLSVIRQSRNFADAVQVLHYVGGHKVSKSQFIAALASA